MVGPTITVRIGATEDIVQAGPRGHRASIPLGAVHVVAESIAICVQPLGPIEWEGIGATRRLHETTRPCLGTVLGPEASAKLSPSIPVGVVPLRGIRCEGVLMITPAIQIGIRATQITQGGGPTHERAIIEDVQDTIVIIVEILVVRNAITVRVANDDQIDRDRRRIGPAVPVTSCRDAPNVELPFARMEPVASSKAKPDGNGGETEKVTFHPETERVLTPVFDVGEHRTRRGTIEVDGPGSAQRCPSPDTRSDPQH